VRKEAILVLMGTFLAVLVIILTYRHIDIHYRSGYAYQGDLHAGGAIRDSHGLPVEEVGMSRLDFLLMKKANSREWADIVDLPFMVHSQDDHHYIGIQPHQGGWFHHIWINWATNKKDGRHTEYRVDIGF
jgi:hypothetical protein